MVSCVWSLSLLVIEGRRTKRIRCSYTYINLSSIYEMYLGVVLYIKASFQYM